jgi:peptidoglycan/xylan/chitin deacetylase (PgdA/CDA1 family)
VTNDRRPRRFVPLVLAVIAIALAAGQSADANPAGSASGPAADASAARTPVLAAVAPQPPGRASAAPSLAPDPTSPPPPASPPGLSAYGGLPPTIRGPALEPAPAVRIPKGGVPIVYYHRVESIPPEFRHWGPKRRRTFLAYDSLPTAFEAQLDWLQAHGYTTILPRDLAAHWDTGARLPHRPVILAFDDGSKTWLRKVLPALRARGMVAEFYLTLDAIDHGNLTWAQVRRLARAGNGIGAHDVHHVQLAGAPGRKPASRKRMFREVVGARRAIAAHVGVAPDSMAYVGGGYNARLIRQVRRAGYTTARSVVRGIHQDPAHRFTLRVVRVAARDDVLSVAGGIVDPLLPAFAAKITGREH